ncbi:MAG: Calx-beta domain-containing protein [Chitinophagales bacterium]
MSKNVFSSDKWAAYSALTGAFLAIPAIANSQITYYDIPDVVIPEDATLTVDVNDDGMQDLMFVVQNSFSGGWLVARVFGNLGYYGVGDPQNAVMGYTSAGSPFADALNSGASVSSSASFVYNSFNVAVLASVYYGETHGAFADGSIAFLGFRFTDGAAIHNGWLRLSVDLDPMQITIYDFAYAETPGADILTGALPDPLPVHVQFGAFSASAAEGAGDVDLSVGISAETDCSFNIIPNEILSTATEGSDYSTDIPGPVVFTTGDPLTQHFTISIVDDAVMEDDEVVVFDITDVTGACSTGIPHQFTLHITDDDTPSDNVVGFSTISQTVSEAAGDISATVHISNSADCTAEISVNTAGSTATFGEDFSIADPYIAQFFEDDLTELPVDLHIVQDILPEPTEEILLEVHVSGDCIASPTNNTMTIFIQDDGDLAVPAQDTEPLCVFYAADDMLTIALASEPTAACSFVLHDMLGAAVMATEIHATLTQLDISKIPDGLYIATLRSGNTAYSVQIKL